MDHHMRIPQKVSGRLVSKKPISLSRAAKLITRFAAVENGSSPAVSIYLQRTADAFNHLVQSRDKRPKGKRVRTEEHSEKVGQEIVDGGDAAAEAPAERKKKKRMSDEDNAGNLSRETKTEIVNDGDAVETPKKKKKAKKSGEESLDSKGMQTEKDSEFKTEMDLNGGDAAQAPSKKKKKRSSEKRQ